ncbi:MULTISPECIES: DsrE family protein [Myroides]|uniref:Uncharacterized protein n=1 Tax=Myroides albus TaxID=2562892 RepID=A0A6I3LR61_9FLAO|nr:MULTISPECIES: DsrE family protein [Myroides]MTG98455.1 hypothetical protein [Myroides albus]MVX34428.1 hypothetical protein [Myroides sp. LoEW2-1]UVD78212.1 DsrE family protein [Myroides albus]
MKDAKHRVVFQLNTDNIIEQNALVTYTNNVKKHWGDDVEIHVVVHGPGIGMVRKSKSMIEEPIKALMLKGIKFFACENTMNARQIDKADIMENVGYVPSGVVYIIEQQEAGWAYIKCNL